MGKTVQELGALAERKAAELHQIFEEHKTDQVDEAGRPMFDLSVKQVQEIRDREEELNEINRELEQARMQDIFTSNQRRSQELKEVVRTIPHDAPPEKRRAAIDQKLMDGGKLSDLVLESREYKGKGARGQRFAVEIEDFDVKTLMTTSAGFSAPNNRGPKLVYSAQRRPVVADLIPTDTTTNSLIKYMEETTFTNSSAAVSEGAAKPESADAWTERSEPVQKIATWLPVTEEQLDDVPQIRNVIDNRLTLMLMLTEETELLTGNGTPPHLQGFLTKSGVQTQAKGSDDPQDAIYKAFTLVRFTGFAEPTGVIMHPNDWQDIRLQRTTEGLYIFGNPAEPGEERLWGKPVVVTPAMTENTALTGDFVAYSHISRKMGIRIDASDSHDVYFVYNKIAIRIEERLALEIYRGSAFAKITSI